MFPPLHTYYGRGPHRGKTTFPDRQTESRMEPLEIRLESIRIHLPPFSFSIHCLPQWKVGWGVWGSHTSASASYSGNTLHTESNNTWFSKIYLPGRSDQMPSWHFYRASQICHPVIHTTNAPSQFNLSLKNGWENISRRLPKGRFYGRASWMVAHLAPYCHSSRSRVA